MLGSRSQKSCGNCTCNQRSWRDNISSILLQIVTFFGLCYLLFVFHYELVQSKEKERAMDSQLSQLKNLCKRIEPLERTNTGPKSEATKQGAKTRDWLKGRDKRGTKKESNENVRIHMVAFNQRVLSGLYIDFTDTCSQVCYRADQHFSILNNGNVITVLTTGIYYIYAQVEYIGRLEMYHYIELEKVETDGAQNNFVLFKGGGRYISNSSHLIGGVACIERNSKIRVKVTFKDKGMHIMSFDEKQTYFGLIKMGDTSTCVGKGS